ncbi:MAG TPA: UpxY family transcription antiterminator [Terriglobia bacterium]|nr:UpxY family transcription antiterminator [Terriglobia bacterium]
MDTAIQSSAWFAVYTRHQHEKSVARFLAGNGVESFLPLYNTAHRWKDRIKQLSLPLFPNYVFIFGRIDRRAAVLQAPGIYDFVRHGGSPAPIPFEEIAAVRRIVEKGLSVEPHPFLRFGDRVRLRTGPLAGFEGILVRKKNLYRLVISVELLVRSVAVEVDAVDIERVAGDDAGNRCFAQWGTA